MIAMALAFVMALSVTACSGGKDKTEFAEFRVQTVMEDLLSQVTIEDSLTLSETDMLDFFGIKTENMAEFAAVTCANGISAQEIVLVKAADEDNAQIVEEKLNNRLNARAAEAENYLPDEYAILKECEVQRHSVYVALIIHP